MDNRLRFDSNSKLITSFILVGVCLLGYTAKDRSLIPKIMTFEQYREIDHQTPYLLHLKGKNGEELIYYGSYHSFDPVDTMFIEIERLFCELKPAVAFNEGGNPLVEMTKQASIERYGEPGFVRFLGKQHGVAVLNLDPPLQEEINALLTMFSKEDLFLFYCLRQIPTYLKRRDKPQFEEYMRRFTSRVGSYLSRKPEEATLEIFQNLFEGFSDIKFNIELISYNFTDPTVFEYKTNQIARESSYFRDCYMVNRLDEALLKYKKVFAVVGASHVVMQEEALRYIFYR